MRRQSSHLLQAQQKRLKWFQVRHAAHSLTRNRTCADFSRVWLKPVSTCMLPKSCERSSLHQSCFFPPSPAPRLSPSRPRTEYVFTRTGWPPSKRTGRCSWLFIWPNKTEPHGNHSRKSQRRPAWDCWRSTCAATGRVQSKVAKIGPNEFGKKTKSSLRSHGQSDL